MKNDIKADCCEHFHCDVNGKKTSLGWTVGISYRKTFYQQLDCLTKAEAEFITRRVNEI